MSSRSTFQTLGYDPYAIDQHSPIPPPPPRDAPYHGTLQRQHVLQIPVVTTGVPSSQAVSHYSTPPSSASHHSPFSLVTPSTIAASSNTPSSTSPMASRLSAHFSVPYDPRDWAPGTDTRAAQIQRLRENAAEDGLTSPPPPYTPEYDQRQAINTTRSPTIIPERAQTLSTARSSNVVGNFASRQTLAPSGAPASNRHSMHVGSYMPPPPSAAPPIPRTRVVSDMRLGYDSNHGLAENNIQPPAARRAASASAGISRVSEAGPSRSTSRTRNWVPGMPLPGPPPGPPPPPSTSRSQSTSGAFDRPGQPSNQGRTRPLRQTIHVSDLGPVPPTPAAWTEDQPLPDNNVHMPLRIDTENANLAARGSLARNESSQFGSTMGTSQSAIEPNTAIASPPGNLSRSSAIRDSSVKGLRERRAQNRNSVILNGDSSALSVQTNPWADALAPEGSANRQDRTPLSGGPGSAQRLLKVASPLAVATTNLSQFTSSPIQMTGTPPISPMPNMLTQMQGMAPAKSAGLPPKSLPTPPLSHKQPLSANNVMSPQSDPPTALLREDTNNFQQDSIRRHTEFLEKEKMVKTDVERLQLFAEYILQESSLRQRKYETAFNSGDFDVENLRTNIFKAPAASRSASNSVSQISGEEKEASSKTTTPQGRPETMWWKDYRPELSPIASMDYDEMSSRGRAPSRWWESQTGSQSGGAGPRKVHRSRRESKYMGLSKDSLMAQSPGEEYPTAFGQDSLMPDPSSYPQEKVDPEAFGYYDDGRTPRRIPPSRSKMPETPVLLDISRFITLPPPYPRHYPAVNNNHPDLAEYRTTVRTLGDLEEVRSRKTRHGTHIETIRADHKRKLSDSRRSFRNSIQAQVAGGSMSFAEAAGAEEAFKMSEFDSQKQNLKTEFDTLQDMVINPLHDTLHERVTQLDSSIQRLQDDLHTDARYQDPDQPQEEGDEKPELLEKLTQLKWLFDVREQIQREIFDLLSERNDKYKAIVLLPYQFSNNLDKVRDTESFFDKDTHNRYMAFCDGSLKRHENFLEIVEQHVRRGVELQSSAFWDIAPGLVGLLQKIPDDLRHFDNIQIPEKEYKENPSYHKHPQQYLYSLLSHAEKSTYQFIEGQVNLQCLLHESKTALVIARYRAVQANDGRVSPRGSDYSDSKAHEEAALTAELKQKASMIEEQWLEALGSQLQAKRERVKTLLQEDDAWEEIAAEDS